MATRYTCDICGEETRNLNELHEICHDFKDDLTILYCDLCRKCSDKIFKPVKEWHTTVKVEFELEDK